MAATAAEIATDTLLRRALTRNEHTCPSCGDTFNPNDAFQLLQVVRPTDYNGLVYFEPEILTTGVYKFYPYYFHDDPNHSCWVETADALESAAKELVDTERIRHGQFLATCNMCQSHILRGELTGIVNSGTFTLDEREPNCEPSLALQLQSTPTYICVVCLNMLNEEVITELWDEGSVRNGAECRDCLVERQWRRQECFHNET